MIEDNIDLLEERQGNKSLITGVTTGYTLLDHKTSGFQNSDLIILAARPGMGKTAFALNIARNAAMEAGVPVAIFSLEMSKEQLSMRMLSSEARLDSTRLRSGFISQEDWLRITEAASNLSNAPIFIDDSPVLTAMEIRAKARRLKLDKNVGLIIIDYIQLMQGRRSAERRELEISEISRALKALAKELNLPVVALSQLNRMLEQRSDKRPQLSDLRKSGALEQDADVVTFIYRDEVYNKDESNPNKGKAEIIISKQRNGPIGMLPLVFLNTYTRFENPASQDNIVPFPG
jgi:replicative DNA helicase